MHPYLAELLAREHRRHMHAEAQRNHLIHAARRRRRHLLTVRIRQWFTRSGRQPRFDETQASPGNVRLETMPDNPPAYVS